MAYTIKVTDGSGEIENFYFDTLDEVLAFKLALMIYGSGSENFEIIKGGKEKKLAIG